MNFTHSSILTWSLTASAIFCISLISVYFGVGEPVVDLNCSTSFLIVRIISSKWSHMVLKTKTKTTFQCSIKMNQSDKHRNYRFWLQQMHTQCKSNSSQNMMLLMSHSVNTPIPCCIDTPRSIASRTHLTCQKELKRYKLGTKTMCHSFQLKCNTMNRPKSTETRLCDKAHNDPISMCTFDIFAQSSNKCHWRQHLQLFFFFKLGYTLDNQNVSIQSVLDGNQGNYYLR